MSAKPDFSSMSTAELRAYVLAHRDEPEALHVYLDKRRAENPNPRIFTAEDNVSEAIDEYLRNRKQN